MRMKTTRRTMLAVSAGVVMAFAASGPSLGQDKVTLSFLVDNAPSTVAISEALAAAYEAKNPNIKIEVESRPGGGDGDNIIKTRLATGEMADVFLYNSGSLFQAINPTQNLVDLTDETFQANTLDSFKSVVTANGRVYGAPIGTAMGGGVLYNRKIYDELGLSVPMTWDEFLANNDAVKASGKTAVIQSFGATWTSQLFVLGDYFNVQAAEPSFADDYTNNKAKYATTPAALRGFQIQAEVQAKGYLNEDYVAATFEEALGMLARGEGAHYPMLTFAIGSIATDYPEAVSDIGFFAVPGPSADSNGLTVWMPAGLYIPANSENVDEAKAFLNFVATVEGCDIQTAAIGATGPYLVKGCDLPDDVNNVVADMLPYFAADGRTAPALEFLSPIKGPQLEHILVEVGSGFRSPEDGAALYDQDVTKQALQLGIAGW